MRAVEDIAITGGTEDTTRRFGHARALLSERTCPEFFTLPAYLRHLARGCAPAPAPTPSGLSRLRS